MPGMKAIPRARGIVLALLSCVLSAGLFRAQIATSLVGRGDDYAARGDVNAALTYYRRAIWLDRDHAAAVDRYAFFSIEERTQHGLRSALDIATMYLQRHPKDGTVRADRALCYQILKRYHAASVDFTAAADELHSAQYYTFAGWARYRLGDRPAARRLWNLALKMDASYGPAWGAIRKTGV